MVGHDLAVEAELNPRDRPGNQHLDLVYADDQTDKKTEKLDHR